MSGEITKVFVADARRRWSDDEKRAIVEESKANPVARVAKKHGVATSLLFRWRKAEGIEARPRSPGGLPTRQFIAVSVAAPPGRGQRELELVLSSGARLKVSDKTDLALLKRVIAALG